MWDCAVIGCPNSRLNVQGTRVRISFHVFPHPVRESNRFRRWLALINNPRLFRLDPLNVYKSVRVCRRHFGPDCFNGECRKLLPTAIPTLCLPEVRPVALVQPMDAVGDELERLLRDERRKQLKRHGAGESPFVGEPDDSSKRQKIGITLLSSEVVEEVECSLGDQFIDRIIAFDAVEEYDDGSLASESRLSSVGSGTYGRTSFSGMIVNASELDQVEILNEPPETLLNDSPPPGDCCRLPVEKQYAQLVRECAASDANNERQQLTEQQIQIQNEPNDKRTVSQTFPEELSV
uniref:THAP-type domain-containing protein n=1 Tax=Anopheles epiroticus TaxID=199890 RepID=A0A182PSG3_9DIPT